MDGFWIILILLITVFNWNNVDGRYDVRKYFNEVYCESVKIGNKGIEKCWKLKEVKSECKLIKIPNTRSSYNNICKWVETTEENK